MMNSFHNDYAIPLENKARDVLGVPDRQRGAIFDADAIELGSFFEIMVLTLRVKSCYQRCTEIDSFIEKYADLLNKKLDLIDESTIQKVLNDYESLLTQIEDNDLDSLRTL